MRNACMAAGILLVGTSISVNADQVFNDDVIVAKDLLCIGYNCVNNESLIPARDGLKIKGTNTAIRFQDTSYPVNYASTDWQINANEGGTTGREAFFISDVTYGSHPFWIEDRAPTNALFIEDSGDIGLGTSMPLADLHLISSSFAQIRLETTSITPYAWYLESSRNGLRVRDAQAVTIPFAVRPGAPSGTLELASNGNIGIGTGLPAAPLHAVRSTGNATDMLRLENNGGVVLRMKDTSPGGQEFTFQSNGGLFRIASPAVPGPEFTMDDFGNVTIKGKITTIGVCNVGCDRVFDEDYDLRPLPEHNALMWEQGHLPAVGPTAEDGPMNLSDKVGGMLNELEHAHIYIGQLHDEIETLKSINAAQNARMAEIEALITAQSQASAN